MRAEKLADSLHNSRYKFSAQKFIFLQKMIRATPTESLTYLQQHEQVKKFYENKGPGMLDRTIGEVFLYQKHYDSAIYYMNKAEV